MLDRNVYHVNTKTSAFSISGSVPATPTRGAYDAAAVGASSAASTPQARVWRSAATEALWSLIVSEQPFTADDVWAAFDARCYRLFVDGATTHLNGYITPWDDFKDDPTALRRPKYEFGATTGLGSLVKRMSKSGWLVQMGTLRSKNPASHSAMVRVWMGNAPTTPLSITV